MSDYLIICDSGCDYDIDNMSNIPIARVPITLTVDDKQYIDDGNINIDSFLETMKRSKVSPKSSAPSPALFMQHFDKAENIFIVTISKHISSTYNNAVLAKKLYEEKNPNKFIRVIDTKSASVCASLVISYISNLLQLGYKPEEAYNLTINHVNNLNTMFVIDDLSNLKKSGRLSHLSSVLATVLNIKPLFASDEGNIVMKEKIRGYKKAISKMLENIGNSNIDDFKDRILGIAYCKAADIAQEFASKAKELYNFKSAVIVEMKPTISVFANIKGVLISY